MSTFACLEVGAAANRYQYNGKEFVEEVGLYEYGFRWYDPVLGRFTSADPISDQFPWVSTYNYAENEPIAHIDLHGLQAVFFQLSGRLGISGNAVPGPTLAGSYGIAIDFDDNILIYRTVSAGAAVGAYAGVGGEIGVNIGANDVFGLKGWGANVGAISSLPSILPGPQFGVEGNISIATDSDGRPTGEGDNGYGGTIAPPWVGGGYGFLGYVDISYTKELKRGKIDDLDAFANDFI